MTEEQITQAWASINDDKILPYQVSQDLGIEISVLRKTLIERYGREAFRTAIQGNRPQRKADGSGLPVFVDRFLQRNPTSEELDTFIANFEIALQKLKDAKA
jgi:hypothetical protein